VFNAVAADGGDEASGDLSGSTFRVTVTGV